MKAFLRTLFGKTKTIRHAPAARARLGLESLDRRDVPSVSSVVASGTTWVVQTDNVATSVTASRVGANVVLTEGVTGHTWSRSAALVGRVEFRGGAGADVFNNLAAGLPVTAYGRGGNDSLYGGDRDDILSGEAGNDRLYGRAGADRLLGGAGNDYADGWTGDDTVAGGDGNDQLYGYDGHDQLTGGGGNDAVYGEAGDDALILIDGGTTDYADGGAGRDVVWRDQNGWWIFASYDTAYAENVYNVRSFANGADRTLNGDNIADPDATIDPSGNAIAANYKSFRANRLFGDSGPVIGDVSQNNRGDCWVMAPLAAAVNDNQYVGREMVADFGDGTYGVRLGGSFYRVDGDLPTWSATSTDPRNAGLGHQGSLWVAIVEKAYAFHRTGGANHSYRSLDGGDPSDANVAFNMTGVGGAYYGAGSDAQTVANTLYERWWRVNNSATIGTGGTPPAGLVGNHAYAVTWMDRDARGNVTRIYLRNPWGGAGADVSITPAQLAAQEVWLRWGVSA